MIVIDIFRVFRELRRKDIQSICESITRAEHLNKRT